MSETSAERLSPVILGASPTHTERARTLVAMQRQGTLCTLLAPNLRTPPRAGHDTPATATASTEVHDPTDPMAGFPYGSVVSYALSDDGSPILLTSALAEHTRNFSADSRASLFVGETGRDGDVLALGRVTLLGVVERATDSDDRARYLDRHPEAAYYADFKDFAFYRLQVKAVRYIGGFGRMSWTPIEDWGCARPDPTAAFAPGVITHMNDDHADSLVLLCRHHAGLSETTEARMQGFDRLGFEMQAVTPQGPRFVRLGFPQPVETPEATRATFIEMVKEARAR